MGALVRTEQPLVLTEIALHEDVNPIRAELAERWPEIGRWLRVHNGEVLFDDMGWLASATHHGVRGEDLAAAYEQQIAYYEWLLAQRLTGHLAGDRLGQYLCALWTDDMTYCCQRLATMARGEEPGEWIPQWVRRPDLDAEGDAIAAQRDARDSHNCQLEGAGVA